MMKKILLLAPALFLAGLSLFAQDKDEKPVFASTSSAKVTMRHKFKLGQKIAFRYSMHIALSGNALAQMGGPVDALARIRGTYLVTSVRKDGGADIELTLDGIAVTMTGPEALDYDSDAAAPAPEGIGDFVGMPIALKVGSDGAFDKTPLTDLSGRYRDVKNAKMILDAIETSVYAAFISLPIAPVKAGDTFAPNAGEPAPGSVVFRLVAVSGDKKRALLEPATHKSDGDETPAWLPVPAGWLLFDLERGMVLRSITTISAKVSNPEDPSGDFESSAEVEYEASF